MKSVSNVVDQPASSTRTAEIEKSEVKIWIAFTSISNIDVIKQQFSCSFLMTTTWTDPKLQGKKNEDIDWNKEWNPKITFNNARDIESVKKTQRLYCVEEGKDLMNAQEMYKVRGTFTSPMDLANFPLDLQELSIILSSEWSDKNVTFEKDMFQEDSIDLKAEGSLHEWSLSDYVDTDTQTLVSKVPGPRQPGRPLYNIKFHAVRKSGYYVWNFILLMFIITGLSFASFAHFANPAIAALTTLLIGVAFKFTISRNLPLIAQSTVLDKYFLVHLLFICFITVLSTASAGIPRTALRTYNFACMVGGLGLFLGMELTFGIIGVLKLRAINRVEWKYGPIYQKRAEEIERMRRERDWYAERKNQPKTPTILLTPATAKQFVFPGASNGVTPKSYRKEIPSHDSTKSYV